MPVNFTPRPYQAVPRLRTSGVSAQVGGLPGNLYGRQRWRAMRPPASVRRLLAPHDPRSASHEGLPQARLYQAQRSQQSSQVAAERNSVGKLTIPLHLNKDSLACTRISYTLSKIEHPLRLRYGILTSILPLQPAVFPEVTNARYEIATPSRGR